MSNHENEATNEDLRRLMMQFFPQVLEAMRKVFIEDENTKASAQFSYRAVGILKNFFDKKVEGVEVKRRKIRENDPVKIAEGEHPGTTLIINFEGGFQAHINIFGNMGREVGAEDTKDTDVTLERLHSTRTDRSLDKPTHIGLSIKNRREEVFSCWCVSHLNQSVALNNLSFESPRTGHTSLPKPLTLRNRANMENPSDQQKKEDFEFKKLRTLLSDIRIAARKLAPPPKR